MADKEKKKDPFRNYADDPILAKKAVEFVKDLHGTLKRKRKPFENLWADCNDAYRGVERRTYFKSTINYVSNDLRDAVLSIVPKLSKAIWYNDVPFDLVPVGTKGDDDELTEINEKLLAWDFRHLKIYLKYVDAIFQKTIFGTTIVKTPPAFSMITKNLRKWEDKKLFGVKIGKNLKREQEMDRTFIGTDFIPTDMFDFWIDPATSCKGTEDAVEFGDCVESIIVKQSQLEAGEKSGLYKNFEKIKDQYIGATKKHSRDTATRQRLKTAGHMQNQEEGESISVKEYGNKDYEIKECYCDFKLGEEGLQRVLITIGADKECLRIQKWKGPKPYLSSRYIPNGYNKEFYGTGIIENNLSNHYESNATRKQVIAARTMGLNQEYLSDSSGFQNKPDKLRTAPNKVHWVKNINGVKPFIKPIGDILRNAMAYESGLKQEKQISTGATPFVQGSNPGAYNDTATGIVRLTEAGNEKFTLPLQVDEIGLLEPFVKRSLQNNINYRKSAFVIRLTDKKPIEVRPEHLSANFDVYSKGSIELQNRNLRQVGLEKAWQLALQAAQIEQMLYGAPLTNFEELKKEIFSNLGLTQPERFLIDKDTLNPEQQQQIATPEMEWILLKRMAEGTTPLMPILIQPGEDYKKHYEDHIAKTYTEEFTNLPEGAKQLWTVHLISYAKVLKTIDQENEKEKEEKIKKQEVESP